MGTPGVEVSMAAGTLPRLNNDSRDALVSEIEAAGGRVSGGQAFCPFHDNRHTPAGSVKLQSDGAWRFHCFVCNINEDLYGVRARRMGKDRTEVIKQMHPMDSSETRANGQQGHREVKNDSSIRTVRTAKTLEDVKRFSGEAFEDGYLYGGDERQNADYLVIRLRLSDGSKSMRQWSRRSDGLWEERGPADGVARPLFRLGKVRQAQEVVVVEGEKCVKAMEKYGFTATTWMGGSNAIAKSDFSPLAGKTVYVWPDKDGERQKFAGQKAGEYVADQAKRHGAKSVTVVDVAALTDLPECGDCADMIEAMEKEGVSKEAITQALWDTLRMGNKKLSSTLRYMHDQASGKLATFKARHASLQQIRPFKPGKITMFNGEPGCGKSFYVNAEQMHQHDNGVKTASLMLEGGREEHGLRALAMKMCDGLICDPDHLEKQGVGIVERARERWGEWLEGYEARIWQTSDLPENCCSIPNVLEWIKARLKEGCKWILVDPVTAMLPKSNNRNNEDRAFVGEVERLAGEHGATIVFVTHPKNGVTDPEQHNMQLGFAYQGFTMSIVFFQVVDQAKRRMVDTGTEKKKMNFNRIMHLVKHRNGEPFLGKQVAMHFDHKTVQFIEQGYVVPQSAQPKEQKQQDEKERVYF